MKVGQGMRAEFGKVNTIHNHALPFIDRPLVTNNLIGGEDGIDERRISSPAFLCPLEELVRGSTGSRFSAGDSSRCLSSSRRQDLSVVGHLRCLPRHQRIHEH